MKHLFLNKELSLIAKDKKFHELCFAYYVPTKRNDELIYQEYGGEAFDMNTVLTNDKHQCVSAPLYSQIIDWFKNKYNFDIEARRMWRWSSNVGSDKINETFFRASVTNLSLGREKFLLWMDDGKTPFTSYYAAIDKAIEEAFKLI